MTDAVTHTEEDTAPPASPAPSARRLKVLVAAYACSPCRGSEEGVGWGWVNAIASRHDVWVLTADYHRDDIERARGTGSPALSNVRFVYVPSKPWHYRPTRGWRFIESTIFKPLMNKAYRLWQRDAYKIGRDLHRQVGFNLVHQITYVGFRFPGHLWKLDVPFVWGPIGGLENVPWRLLPMMGPYGALYHVAWNVINSMHKRFLRSAKEAFRCADGGTIAATTGIQREIRRHYGQDSEVICEVGPVDTIAADHSARTGGSPLRLAWSGLHEPRKALPLLLRGLRRLRPEVRWHLDILGQGPRTRAWRRLARRLGIDGRCTWHRWLPRDEAVSVLHDSHVFIITSLKDLTSTVLLEALSQGVPVICLDHCGFRDVVNEECGIGIAVESRQRIESGIAEAISSLWSDESRRRRLADGALLRVRDFSWERKAEALDSIYRLAVFGRRSDRNQRRICTADDVSAPDAATQTRR